MISASGQAVAATLSELGKLGIQGGADATDAGR